MNLSRNTLSSEFGYINYGYDISANILVFMGSYIYKEFRGMGKFKEMVKELFLKFSVGTIVQAPIKNKKLVSMFERMNFTRVNSIEYWGPLSGSILMQGIITKQTLELL